MASALKTLANVRISVVQKISMGKPILCRPSFSPGFKHRLSCQTFLYSKNGRHSAVNSLTVQPHKSFPLQKHEKNTPAANLPAGSVSVVSALPAVPSATLLTNNQKWNRNPRKQTENVQPTTKQKNRHARQVNLLRNFNNKEPWWRNRLRQQTVRLQI